MIDLLPFFIQIFGSELFTYFCYPCLGIALLSGFFQILYSFFDRRCD